MSWASRLRHLRRRVLDDDLDVELQSYFDIQIERRMARGLSREEAQRVVPARTGRDGSGEAARTGGAHGRRAGNHVAGRAAGLAVAPRQSRLHVLRGADDRARPRRQRRHLQPGRRRAAQVQRLPGAGADRPVVGKAAARHAKRHLGRELHRLGAAEPVVRGDGGDDGATAELHAAAAAAAMRSNRRNRLARRTSTSSASKPALGRTFARGEDQRGHDKVVVVTHRVWAEPPWRRCPRDWPRASC